MPDDPKSLLRRLHEGVNGGDLSVLDELFADDLTEHSHVRGFEPTKEGVKELFAMFRSAFPDLRIEAREMLVDGELVCARTISTGTHEGEFFGIAPTGRHIEVEAVDIVRIRDGQIAEHWGVTDVMSLMQQLGATPGLTTSP